MNRLTSDGGADFNVVESGEEKSCVEKTCR